MGYVLRECLIKDLEMKGMSSKGYDEQGGSNPNGQDA